DALLLSPGHAAGARPDGDPPPVTVSQHPTAGGRDRSALSGEAGTVTIVHYDLLHRGMPNTSDRMRYMVKFLFTRMSEPQASTWNHRDSAWQPTGDPQAGTWRHLWYWQPGAADAQAPATDETVPV